MKAGPDSGSSLWRLAGGPLAWAAHFLLCYATTAIWCAKAGLHAPGGGLRLLLWGYTGVALATIVLLGWRAWRRGQFLGFVAFLLCGLSFVAVLYSALAIAIVGTCR